MKKTTPDTMPGSGGLLAWKLLKFYGKDPALCFNEFGLNKAQLAEPDSRIDSGVYHQIWDYVHNQIDDPCAGLNAPQFWHPSLMGALGYALLSSSTIRKSLQRLVRFQQVVSNDSDFSLIETDKGLLVQQNNPRHQSNNHPLIVDVSLSLILHICRFNYGNLLDPVELNLMRSKPDDAGRYYAYYRCPVNFSEAANNIVLPFNVLDEPLPAACRHLAQVHDQVLQKYLAKQHRSDLITRVRESVVAYLPSGDINKDQVAKALLMSTRTLQRRLKEEDSSFLEVLNETRQELALQYIQDDSLPLKEVSYLLGFSDSAAFSRAFKRWTGESPSRSKQS